MPNGAMLTWKSTVGKYHEKEENGKGFRIPLNLTPYLETNFNLT